MFFNKKLKRTQEELQLLQEDYSKSQNDLKIASDHNLELLTNYGPLIDKDKALHESQHQIDLAEKRLLELDVAHQATLKAHTDELHQQFRLAEMRLLELNDKYQTSLKIHSSLESEVNLYEDTLEIGSFGLYKRQYEFDTSEKFKHWIDENYGSQKQVVKEDNAVVCDIVWEVGGSKSEGKKMTNHYKKLMLFAFNGECDGLIAKVKWNNVEKVKERILKAFENINKLGTTQRCTLTNQYLGLKLQELALTYEYQQKIYEEKEEQRRIREQMRDEEKAQKELERAQRDAEDEEKRFQKALDKANLELGSSVAGNVEMLNEQIKFLEQKLQEAHERKERVISLAQLTKVGHIYVISNLGSFGEDVYKIGMTRRLDPTDRIKELSDASVPFQFDIHAIIYSENAPQLEYELHKKFTSRRLNRINNKKEFFKVTLSEIEEFVNQHANAEIEFTKLAEAREYRETLTLLKELNSITTVIETVSNFPTSLI